MIEDVHAPRLHRRIMAYLALVALIGGGIGAFTKELWPANADLLTAAAYILGAIVLGYMGAQIAPEVFRKNGAAK